MEITDKVVDELAHLARLEFKSEAKEQIKADLKRILSFCEQLNEIDTEHVKPLIYMSDVPNSLREDVVKESLPKHLALKNAPKADSDYFRVPKVLSKTGKA